MRIVRIIVQEEVPGIGICSHAEVFDRLILDEIYSDQERAIRLEDAYQAACKKLDKFIEKTMKAGPAPGKLP